MTKRPTLAHPIVYAGTSISPREVEARLPTAIVRPPIRRGDLYRDRTLRGSLFVIIDGTFWQSDAVSPREVRDVLEDGAVVVGGASMGALRAAECWPLGMRGVGAIYRLFRRGVLLSDDEVAVSFELDGRFSSVALIDVRATVAHALRRGALGPEAARDIVQAATSLHFSDRRWPRILQLAGVGEGPPMLSLKRRDAERTLDRVARLLRENPAVCVIPRAGRSAIAPPEREVDHDGTVGSSSTHLKRELALYLFASGRYRRYVARPRSSPLARNTSASRLLKNLAVRPSSVMSSLWQGVELRGELDAELLRLNAVRMGAGLARQRGLTADGLHRVVAGEQIATEHGHSSWEDLERTIQRLSATAWRRLQAYRDELALARTFRDLAST